MRWTREAYLDLMTFGDVDRPFFTSLFGPLVGLPEEWRAQGASEAEIEMKAFDWDYVDRIYTGLNTRAFGATQPIVLEETDSYRITRDYLGRTLKLDKQAATIPLPLDFPVKTMDDWLKLKPMFTWNDARIHWPAIAEARHKQQQGYLVAASIPGGYDMVRELMGEELGCMAYYEQPELIADIMATLTDTATRGLKAVCAKLTIDELNVHEDFAGKSGPLIGPKQIREHLRPYYRSAWDIVQDAGGRIFEQDTDGNINSVIEPLLECGLTAIHPMEPAAGMDIVQLRQQYGNRLAMAGGIDKHVLRQDKQAIRRELEYKLQPLMQKSGGMRFALDHRITNGTPIDNYRYYVSLGRELLGLPPLMASRQSGSAIS